MNCRPDNRLRVAMLGFRAVGDSYGLGGIERVVAEVGSRMAERGHDVTLFCRTRYAPPDLREHRGMTIRPVSAIYTKSLESPSNALFATCHALRGFDIVHYHATMPALFSGIPRLLGGKTVVTVHGLDWKRAKWGPVMRRAQKVGAWAATHFPNACIVCSQTLQRHYRETYGVETRYIPNAVTPAETRALDKARRHGIEPGKYILFLSRLVPEKGCHTLLEAFRRVETDTKLVVVGQAPYMGDYRRKLKKLAEGDPRIVFTGPVYGEEKDELYSNAAFFCLPSEIEGMALVILEAMNFGRCCLVSDIPENLELVAPGASAEKAAETQRHRYGHSFHDRDPEDLARQLRYLIKNPEETRALGERSRPYARENFNWDRSTDAHLRCYREILGRTD